MEDKSGGVNRGIGSRARRGTKRYKRMGCRDAGLDSFDTGRCMPEARILSRRVREECLVGGLRAAEEQVCDAAR